MSESDVRPVEARILVVDDEPGTTELMAAILGHAGFDVVRAHDGLEALVRARESRFDLILLDVMLPALDGREACRAIKRDVTSRDVPVVLHSSADEADVDWRAAGADGFLQKPFEVRRLPEVVRHYLRRRRAQSA